MAQSSQENPVDVTMLFTAVYRCKLCGFHTLHGEDMKTHMHASHQTQTEMCDSKSKNGASTSKTYGTRQRGKSTAKSSDKTHAAHAHVDDLTKRVQTIFREVERSSSIKCLASEQVALKIFPTAEEISDKKRSSKRKGLQNDEQPQVRKQITDMFQSILELMDSYENGDSAQDGIKAINPPSNPEALDGKARTLSEKLKYNEVTKDLLGSTRAKGRKRMCGKATASKTSPVPRMEAPGEPPHLDNMNKDQKAMKALDNRRKKRGGASKSVITDAIESRTRSRSIDIDMSRMLDKKPEIQLAQSLSNSNVRANQGVVEKLGEVALEMLKLDEMTVAQLQTNASGDVGSHPVKNAGDGLERREEASLMDLGKEPVPSLLENVDAPSDMKTRKEMSMRPMAFLPDDKEAQNNPETVPIPSLPREPEAKQEVEQPSTPLSISKLFGNVDFQDIAQRASKSNPDATTITVVQHTGGNRPPTTIHFKKSRKSSAIIPTCESLGIMSPFSHKGYAGNKIFACKECHSRYKTQNELERHTAKKHKKKKGYLCEICGDSLATRSGMKIHIVRKHASTTTFSCDVCDYATRSAVRFDLHQKKHSKAESDFFCKPCQKSFVTELKLQQHCNSPMHKNAVDPIICEHCGYVTTKRDNFLVHLRKHTGEKPYKCRQCDYAAADGSTLKRHVMARHSTIRPFRCSHCQFSCVDKKGLTIHMRKHTGERPYTCDQCPYSAKRMGALTVHMRTHLRNREPATARTDIHVQGANEVASYVDISNIPFTTSHVVDNYTGNLPAGVTGDNMDTVATSCSVMTSQPCSSDSTQLSTDVIVTRDTAESVRALWQACNEVKG